ncbi:MAG: methionyl-tRNA formyltransferase [Firmicutes bacterium]|nr:methionyl-tRNA formyltransferase [Bacillota bacterium]
MNVIFLGTPEFAVSSLAAILNSSHRVLAVVSQPDRETDKKGRVVPTPVKAFISGRWPGASGQIKEDGFMSQTPNPESRTPNPAPYVLQFDSVSKEGIEAVKALNPDVMVTAAFGQILSDEFLSIAPVYNVHASLLPLYRGSSPIQAAILNGDKETGVTVMQTVKDLDAGDILLQEKLAIGEDEPFYSLHGRLAELGAKLIVEALDKAEKGSLSPASQNHASATHTQKIVKSHGRIDWSEGADLIARKIRAYNPWPTGYTFFDRDNIKIFEAKTINMDTLCDVAPGTILCASEKAGLCVQCGSGILSILSLQAPGKRVLPVNEFLRGYRIAVGAKFE